MREPEHVDCRGVEHGQPGHAEAVLAPRGRVEAKVLQLRLTGPVGGVVIR